MGLLFFDVMMMVTYRSRFKGRYAHPWPLPLKIISSDKGLLSVVIVSVGL